jgi:hypothetical protein
MGMGGKELTTTIVSNQNRKTTPLFIFPAFPIKWRVCSVAVVAAAEYGIPEGQILFGLHCRYIDARKRKEETLKWFRKSAERGSNKPPVDCRKSRKRISLRND